MPDSLKYKSNQIVNRITQFSEDFNRLIRDKANIFYDQLAEHIRTWIQEYEFNNQTNIINPLKINDCVTETIEELNEYLYDRIEDKFSFWQEKELQPFIISRLEVFQEDLVTKASDFIREVEQLRAQLANVEPSMAVAKLERLFYSAEIPINYNLEWIKAAFVAPVTAGAVLGGIIGSSMLLGLSITIFTPISLVTILAATILIVGGLAGGEFERAGKRIQDKIKEEASKQFPENIYNSREKQIEDFSTNINNQLIQIKDVVEQGLSKEIQGLKDQVISVLNDKKQGEEYVQQKLEEITTVSNDLNNLEGELDDLMSSLNQL